ncbi:triacylglycerol lipase [Vibrio paucivorans]|uniref:Triacylglycerol lipase n=1 Tax=Vibrio paucivorans TaxID=2829489 RepID=A0A9X3HRM2_9VIBR|nr:triacylglycerol lipase [Vibrio paucivorans]MCW8334044.1 triacylglycerol lipase [Vibrio paucivorans]
MKVIILHGLYMHGMVMQPLSQKLQKLGYDSAVISYNTLSINEETVFNQIDHALAPNTPNILVGHSLGGLMIKHYLAARPNNSNRISHVVAIGSPLRGASIAMKIQDMGFGALLGNSPHYGLDEHDDVWLFPQKLGSIAGTTPVGLRPLLMGNGHMSDGTVTVEETKIKGMTDHIEIRGSHTAMIYTNYVPNQIDHFIRFGLFKHRQTTTV